MGYSGTGCLGSFDTGNEHSGQSPLEDVSGTLPTNCSKRDSVCVRQLASPREGDILLPQAGQRHIAGGRDSLARASALCCTLASDAGVLGGWGDYDLHIGHLAYMRSKQTSNEVTSADGAGPLR